MELTHKDKFIGRIIFKSYKIKKKLGEGSFGKVYVVSSLKTNELFAAKLVSFLYILVIL
jgi:serine/threonine protein kinase